MDARNRQDREYFAALAASLSLFVVGLAEQLPENQWKALREHLARLSLDLRGGAAEPEIQEMKANAAIARCLDDLLEQAAEQRDQAAERRALQSKPR